MICSLSSEGVCSATELLSSRTCFGGRHGSSLPVSLTRYRSPQPWDHGALGQSFLKPGHLLPNPCFLRFGRGIQGISELVFLWAEPLESPGPMFEEANLC